MLHVRACLPLLFILVACDSPPAPAKQADAGASAEKQAENPAEKQVGEAKPAAEQPGAAAPTAAGSTELTAEELALIDADPKTLTPEQNRKRAYALRKKVMQNPDSEAAKTLREAQAAVMAGEIDPLAKPKPADNGVVIPLPDHLKDQDQTYGKPAL